MKLFTVKAEAGHSELHTVAMVQPECRGDLPAILANRVIARLTFTAPVYYRRMGALGWIAAAVASGVALLAVGWWRRSAKQREASDVGPVSESWLAEQRRRKD